MRPIAAFVDPGYSAGVAVLTEIEASHRLDVYQLVCRNEMKGRVQLSRLLAPLVDLYEEIPLGVLELGWSRAGRSSQSSAGLALTAGFICGSLPVARWEKEDPTWQNVKGWELMVGEYLKRNCRDLDAGGPSADAFDALGLMMHWSRRQSPHVRLAPVVDALRVLKLPALPMRYKLLTP